MFFYNLTKEKKKEIVGLNDLNILENHIRINRTMLILMLCITAATLLVIFSGKASDGVTFMHVFYAVIGFVLIMTINYLLLKNALVRPWSKYVMTISILLIISICRIISPSHETIALI